jgi:hypothetical protein
MHQIHTRGAEKETFDCRVECVNKGENESHTHKVTRFSETMHIGCTHFHPGKVRW